MKEINFERILFEIFCSEHFVEFFHPRPKRLKNRSKVSKLKKMNLNFAIQFVSFLFKRCFMIF